jgi:hypothetical protein
MPQIKIDQTNYKMNAFLIWLSVMAAAITILAIIIFIPNYVSAFRDLRRDGVPNPSLVIRKRFWGVFLGHKKNRISSYLETSKIDRLKNILVWISWDIRWVSGGTGLSKVVDVIRGSDNIALVIELRKPVQFIPSDIEASQVIFEPYNPSALIKTNTSASVYGILRTPESLKQKNITGRITCELVTI